MSKSTKNKKQRFIALVQLAAEVGGRPDCEMVSKELDVPVITLHKWLKEFAKANTTEQVLDMLEVDTQIVEEIAEKVIAPAIEVANGPKIEIIDGVIQVTDEHMLSEKEKQALQSQKISQFKDRTNGLFLLQEEVQGTAGSIVGKIADKLEENILPTQEIVLLTNALTSIQNAFFNRPTTNIQVNAMGSEGEPLLKAFRNRLES